jgi:hypothetical protein
MRSHNKHRYEYSYEMNKVMYIRYILLGHQIESFKSQVMMYCYLRANMDVNGIDYVLERFLIEKNRDLNYKKLYSMIWLAWGHKSRLINSVGIGDYTYPKENK